MTDGECLDLFRKFADLNGCDLFAAFQETPATQGERVVRNLFLSLNPHHQQVVRKAAMLAAAMGD
jgi:hypothetical protein